MKMLSTDRLIPTTKANQCPICSNVTGKCRTKDNSEQAVLCAGTPTARTGDKEGAYTCVNDKGKGHTTHTWILSDDNYLEWNEQRKIEYQLEKKRRELLALEDKQARIAAEIPIIERDRINREILDQLELNEHDKQHLLDRGFSEEQILLFRSVEPYQKVNINAPYTFPGLSSQGFADVNARKLIVTSRGILCPIIQDGLVVAFKVRFTNAKESQRYSSVSSKDASFHIQGEQPLAVLNPSIASKNYDGFIFVTEGNEIKPVLINQKYDVPVLGGGRYWHRSSNHAAKYLMEFKEKYGNKIALCLDAGDLLNSAVYRLWLDEANYFISQGFEVSFVYYGQVFKDQLDIDELTSLDGVQYISVEEFKDLIEQYNDESFKQWNEVRKFTPTIKINQSNFTFPKNSIPKSLAIVAVKSPLGSGKTAAMIEVMKETNNRVFLLGSLNNLLVQTISRADDSGVQIYHLHFDEASNLISDVHTNIACCVDSMQYLDGYFKGTDIFIDEIDSVIRGILTGGTLNDRQGLIMHIFEKAVKECNRVFTFDGNNSDLITDFIHKFATDKLVVKIENTAKPKPQTFKFVEGYDPTKNKPKKNDKSPITRIILDENVRPFIASDSKNLINSLDELLKDTKKGLTLTSDTVNEDFAKQFLNNPDKFLANNPVDYFAISPSANSGISITNRDNFTNKVSIFTGVLTTNQQLQLLSRLRPELEHFIFCPDFTLIKNNTDYPTVEAYQSKTIDKIILSAQKAAPFNSSQMLNIAAAEILKLKDNNWYNLSAILAVADNYERNNLKRCLIHALEQMGHKVEIVNLDIDEGINTRLKEAKEKLIKTQAEEIFKAEPLESVNEAYKLVKTSPSKALKRRIDKTILLDRLPGLEMTEFFTAELIEETITNRNYLTQHELFYRLSHPESSRLKSEVSWYYKSTSEFSFLLPLSKDIHLKVDALNQLNLLQFLDGRKYYKNSSEVIELYNKALNNPEIALALDLKVAVPTVSGKERIDLLRRCLKLIGVKLKNTGKPLIDGKQHYCYAVDKDELNNPERLAIIEAIDRKYTTWTNSESVTKVNWNTDKEVVQPKVVIKASEQDDTDVRFALTTVIPCILDDIDTIEYEDYQIFSNGWSRETAETVDLYLPIEVKEKLKALKPNTVEGKLVQSILEAERKGKEFLDDVINSAKEMIGNITEIIDMLPIRLRELCTVS